MKAFDITANPFLLLTFLNNGLRNILGKMGYVEIGRSGKYFNCQANRKEIDNLYMFSGYKANFVSLEKGYFLRVDSASKIVRNETVMQFIDKFYKMHENKDRIEKRMLLKNELSNKIVMANYGSSQYYTVMDIEF